MVPDVELGSVSEWSGTTWDMLDHISNKVRKIQLPELQRNTILGSSEGWLVHANEVTAEIGLFNPFIRSHIQLPPTITFPTIVGKDYDQEGNTSYYHVKRLRGLVSKRYKLEPQELCRTILGSAYMGATIGGFTVAITNRACSIIAVTRIGDQKWYSADTQGVNCDKCVFFKGLLYMMSMRGKVMALDLNGSLSLLSQPFKVANEIAFRYGDAEHLVVLPESGAMLLVAVSWNFGKISIFRIDEKALKWARSNLNGHSLFVSARSIYCQCTLSLSPSDHHPNLSRNQIYLLRHGDVEQLNLDDPANQAYPLSMLKILKEESDALGSYKYALWISPVWRPISIN